MKTLLVARKNLLELFRDPTLLAISILTPILFIGIVWIGYGTAPKLATHPVLVIGDAKSAEAQRLLPELENYRYPDGRPAFSLQYLDDVEAADTAIKAQTADIILKLSTTPDGQLAPAIRGDTTSMKFISASTLLEKVLASTLDQLGGISNPLQFIEQPLDASAAASEFEAYTPGMVIFAILSLIPQTAMMLAREVRAGTLKRLQISQLRGWELMSGIALAQMVIAAVQVVVMFLAAIALGFHNQGSLFLGVLIGWVISFGAVGMGLIVACISSNDSDAINIGFTFTMLQVFLSGAFFPAPAMTLFRLGGYEIGIFDFIPATHGMLALQQVMIGGAGLSQVAFRIAAALVLSVFYFLVGVFIFGRWRSANSRMKQPATKPATA